MKYFVPLAISVLVLGVSSSSATTSAAAQGGQGKDLPNGTAMSLGKFQKDLCLREGVSMTAFDCPDAMNS